LGPLHVHGIILPGPFSSKESARLGYLLSKNLGIEHAEISIKKVYSEIVRALEASFLLDTFSVAHENIQARIRGLILMAFSNSKNSLLLTTGNKSEYATGYSTLYGDMCGGLAPLGDLTKKQVYDLAHLYNKEREWIPERIITRPPTAELRKNQKDQDTLPPYEDLDKSVVQIIEQRKSPRTPTDFWLLNQLGKTEFKRWQAAPILKVSSRAFGRGRRWPITFKNIIS
jgi:NAD+ synthase (glutamine-hydrolysing)